jgi:hypothetical protein
VQTNLCACCLLSCWAFLSEFLMPFSPDNILEPTHVAQVVTVLIRTLKTTDTDCAEWLFFISVTSDSELKRCLSTPWRNIGGSRGIAPPFIISNLDWCEWLTSRFSRFTPWKEPYHILGGRYTERQECRLCGYEKEGSVHIVCDCPVLACKRNPSLLFTTTTTTTTTTTGWAPEPVWTLWRQKLLSQPV